MRVTHYARRSLAAAGLALTLAGCGKDGNAPNEFDPQGTAADMAAAQDAFASDPTASFAAVGEDISVALNGSQLVQSSAALAVSGPSKASERYVRQIAKLIPTGGAGIQASVVAIPSELAGKTFVWDESTDTYVVSDLSGAPSNGVRFLLYAVDPVLLRPVEPVVETGYVDVIDQSTASSVDIRVKVVESGVTYLDYSVVGGETASGGVVTIDGYAFNGTVRANFRLKNSVFLSNGGVVIVLDYTLDVPSRGLSIDWTATLDDASESVTLDLSVSGPNGNVSLVGSSDADGGTFTVKVNGDTFATITVTGGSTVITGATGDALTPDEEQAMETVFDSFEGSLDAFGALLMPVS
jgi:predicted small lipoprotein YifL